MNINSFSWEDQIAFAELSGDFNPIHIDEIISRRLLFGGPIVHGIHILCWGLDKHLENCYNRVGIESLHISFFNPLKLETQVTLVLNNTGHQTEINWLVKKETIAKARIVWNKCRTLNRDHVLDLFPPRSVPAILREDQIKSKSGSLDLYLNIGTGTEMFPNMLRCMNTTDISTILATTRLVGTECPGLNSLYSELDLSFNDSYDGNNLQYKVAKFEDRFRYLSMAISSPAMSGNVTAFIRPNIYKQDSYSQIRKLVKDNEFISQRALVIGGSRGLGEVTTKLLASGGADVKFTYHKGKLDAQNLMREINSHGGTSNALQFDTLSDEYNNFIQNLSDWWPTHLYYFATPFIANMDKSQFNAEVFREFCDYYVNSFYNFIDLFANHSLKNVFCPSSLYVDELPSNMSEYTTAKYASEIIARILEKKHGNLNIYQPRLPKLATDQTTSLSVVSAENPTPIIFNHLRQFNIQRSETNRSPQYSNNL